MTEEAEERVPEDAGSQEQEDEMDAVHREEMAYEAQVTCDIHCVDGSCHSHASVFRQGASKGNRGLLYR